MEITMDSYKHHVVFEWNELETGYFGNIFLSSFNGQDPQIDTEHMTKEFAKQIICEWIDKAEMKG
jgi:hypothetical protein